VAGSVRPAATALVLAGAVGVAGASFLPWVRSGRAHRSSYEVVEAADRLGVVSGAGALAVRAWFLLPLVVAGACLAASVGRPRLAVALGGLAGAAAALLVHLVGRSALTTELGWTATLVAGAVVLVGAALFAIGRNPRSVVTREGGLRRLKRRG
jgi:hypothetical protein